MEYVIKMEGERYCIYDDGGERIACHDSEAEAKTHMGELDAGEMKSLPEVATRGDGKAVETVIQPNILASTIKRVKDALQRGNNDIIAFKVNPAARTWIGIWSNNFEDREGEIFTAKAIDDYIARVDMGIIPTPELWLWHTPGTRLGEAEHVTRVGAFAVAMGTFDQTAAATKGMHTLAKTKGLGMSHGYAYSPDHKQGRVYHQFNTFELSVLPRDKAANSYTSFEENDMKLEGEKKTFLEGILGIDQTAALEKALEDATTSLTERGVASKEFGDFTSVSAVADTDGAKEAVEASTQAIAPLLLDLINAQDEGAKLETALISRIKELETMIVGFKTTVETLQAAVDLRPRIASESKETVDSKASADEKAAFMGKRDPFWGTITG